LAGEVGAVVGIPQPNTESNIKVAKPQTFNGKAGKVLGFLIVYRLFIRMKMRNDSVEEQIQWILSYMQRELADI